MVDGKKIDTAFAVQYPSRPVVDRTPAPAAGPDRVATLAGASEHWRRTHQNVTQLRVEIEDLKKNIVRLTSNNVQDRPVERKARDTTHKPISKSKDVPSLQVDNKQISSEKISQSRIEKKERIAKTFKKVNEIGLPPKRLINKVENSPKVAGQGLITKSFRNSQASKIHSKNNYPQGFLFGKETKSTWMDTMNDPIPNKKEQECVNVSHPDRVLEKERKIAELQNHCIENCSSDRSPKAPTAKAFDRLLDQLTKWTNDRQLNSKNINENNPKHFNKNSEQCISLIKIKEKSDHSINKNVLEQVNENENKFMGCLIKSEKENVLKTSKKKPLHGHSLSNQDARSSLISEKYPINTSQLTNENSDFHNLSSTNKVQSNFHIHTKTPISDLKKSAYHYDENEVLKVQKGSTFHDGFFSNSRCNEDKISKPISCSFKKIETGVTKKDAINSPKIYDEKDLTIDWEKVHSLVYKYITTKIKRLQNTPKTETNANGIDDSSVSNLLSKLCYMIKNDLRKMKNLPTYHRESAQLQKETSKKDEDRSFSVLKIEEKPLLNLCKGIKTFEYPPNNKNSPNAINRETLTLTMSCQVSGKIDTENKSCLTIEKKCSQLQVIYDKNKIPVCDRKKAYVSCACSPTVSDRQCSCNILKGDLFDKNWKGKTIDTVDFLNNNVKNNVPYNLNKPVKITKSDQVADRNRSYIYKEKRFTQTIFSNKETGRNANNDFNTQTLTKSNPVNEKDEAVSCFGCTVECICDKSLGPCVCTKGILINKRDEVEKLWKMSIDNNHNKLDNFNLYVLSQRRNTENPKAVVLSTSKTISNNAKNTYRKSETCEMASMNNLFVPSDVVSKTDNAVKNVGENSDADGARSKCSSLKSEMGVSLSDDLCTRRGLLPNINLGRHSTNSSLPVGKNIISEIHFWSQMLPEELS
ncbi:hypothetical protein EVAR_31698_1 [Eumeta japonica]|uniref:Uncharacterized protein n=1 Tax=Eumeta variegata TaxID=151549 RepID=A0A4C1VVQ9_EUMVA|nr:hypothetical protein EVAR_31698_1 [Eumeta japonica]